MTFSYDLTNSVGKVRLEIGDTLVSPDGLLPSGANFSDEEITHFLATETGIYTAAARALEIAARKWANAPRQSVIGGESLAYDTAQRLSREAKQLRIRYGQTTVTAPSGSVRIKAEPWLGPEDS